VRDFGIHRETGPNGIVLECRYVAPGVTMQDVTNVFECAKNEASLTDHVSADPSKWPDIRGLIAVTELLVSAFDKDSTR
jgi:hypothetical protein